jgi:hypothetical protein
MDEARPNALTYGITPSAPASISPVDIDKWKATISPTFKHYFTEEYNELVRKYEKLVRQYEINKLVYESEINFKPDIGKTYYLYQNKNGIRFLSMVEPEFAFWGGFLGKFKLNSQYAWEEPTA